MAVRKLPPQSVLLQLLRYEPETGKLYWRERGPEWFSAGHRTIETYSRQWNARWARKEAFNRVRADGYMGGKILGTEYLAHRIIVKMMSGVEPDEVDHINGVRTNNRWDNLRNVTKSGNQRNCSRRKDNKSGVTGVHWHKASGKWYATIYATGKQERLGTFDCFGSAIRARKTASAEHGYSPRHGMAQ
jgi:hypothetical protein